MKGERRSSEASDPLKRTRASLVRRLKNWEDHESWKEFLALYGGLLRRVAMRSGLTESEADDAVQDTVITVAKTMSAFQYDRARCSFKTWLRHLAAKRIADQFRKRMPVTTPAPDSSPAGTPLLERIPDPNGIRLDDAWETEWKTAIFNAAVQRARRAAAVEQFQIFDFHVLKNWPVKRVASTFGISTARVYLAKHRVMRLVLREAKRLEKDGM